MSTIITFSIILLVIILIIGPILFLQIRRTRREQKNYERGLKTVPLLIHLPPPSDDIDVNGRDVRDVMYKVALSVGGDVGGGLVRHEVFHLDLLGVASLT